MKNHQIIKKQILILMLFLSFNSLHSQVLISNSSGVPDSTAMLEVKSTEKGFLPPRMTATQRDAIVNPTPGLIVYCSDCLEMQMFNDTAWTNMIGLPPSPPTSSVPTITIGTQTWMANNLDVGTMITGATNMTNNSIIEKYCYANDPANCATYGALYQWNEMMQYVTTPGVQGVCPTGFHLPTDNEWKTLEMHLGMTQAQADATGELRGTDEGSQLAGNEPLWSDGDLDMNGTFGSSGFAALPGGLRFTSGQFFFQSDFAYFWSSSESGGNAWYRYLSDHPRVSRDVTNKSLGFSVRCVQD